MPVFFASWIPDVRENHLMDVSREMSLRRARLAAAARLPEPSDDLPRELEDLADAALAWGGKR
jgi:hypothetical protein